MPGKKKYPHFGIENEVETTSIGYAHLVETYDLSIVAHPVWTFVHASSTTREIERDGVLYRILPSSRHPGSRDIDHLLFALRYEGPSLPICRALFARADSEMLGAELVEEVRRQPTSRFRRIAWFLFEEINGRELPLPDLEKGNYIPLLDPREFVTGPVRKKSRQRIDLNLLGILDLAPTIRRTTVIDQALLRPASRDLREHVERLLGRFDESVIRRALSFLYTRETMASFEIENERPSRNREERFVALLRRASEIETLTREILVDLQNETVDPRFANEDWRSSQIYVGESIDLSRQFVHYVGPRARDLDPLMRWYFEVASLLVEDDELEPVLIAAVLSFLFVLIHPFDDGNGRLHRWLIRWVLVRREVTPPEVVIPVSAVIQSRRREYEEVLESFSRPLLRQIEYSLDETGRMTVDGETLDLYRHPDLTPMAEALVEWLGAAIREELVTELRFLVDFDQAKRALQAIVDMPDRLIGLFVKLCRQNAGSISARKRERHFAKLTDDEIGRMEAAVREAFRIEAPEESAP